MNNVFLGRWKFYQKIVSISSNGFLVVPSEAVVHADGGNTVLVGGYFSGFASGSAVCTREEIIIHHCLVLQFDLVTFGGHIGVVGFSYQPRYVI